MHQIERVPGVAYTVLVPNLRGLERALSCQPDGEPRHVVQRNPQPRQPARDAPAVKAQLTAMIDEAGQAGVPVNVSLSTVFGCPFEAISRGRCDGLRAGLPVRVRLGITCVIPRAWPIPTRWRRCARRSSARCRRPG